MRIKRYEGQYVHEVIAEIRDDLGADAVVLHTRWRNPAGLRRLLGGPKVEVWAGVREPGEPTEAITDTAVELARQVAEPEAAPQPAGTDDHSARAAAICRAIEARGQNGNGHSAANPGGRVGLLDVYDEPPAPTSPRSPAATDDPTVALLSEFNAALARIESKLDGLTSERAEAQPSREQALLEAGVSPDVATEVVAAANGRSVTELLFDTFQCTGEIDPAAGPKVVALVGPSGVGKTTTTAKLAGRYGAMAGRRVMLCSTDTRRIGTFEQLRALGELMQIPTCPIHSPDEAAGRIQMARRTHDLVFLDTPACLPGGEGWNELVDTLIAVEPDQIHLVLAANTRAADAARLVEGFRAAAPLFGVTLTKLDETREAGLLVDLAWRHMLPIAYLADGDSIPGDIAPADAERLVDLVWSRRCEPAGGE